jgi:hypothetical protein
MMQRVQRKGSPHKVALVDHALEYAALGLPVFPCNPADKAPLTTHGFKDASTDKKQIQAWWQRSPDALIGMPTGRASGIDVLDIDVNHNEYTDGFVFVKNWPQLSPVQVSTPRGGAHVWFRSEGKIHNSTDDIAPGVDTRGTGGYVIVPPSYNATGAYAFVNGSKPDPKERAKLPTFPVEMQQKVDVKYFSLSGANRNPQADPQRIADAMRVIPNDDAGWDGYKRLGMAVWAGTGGSPEGFAIWDAWAQKSTKKYNAANTLADWNAITRSPPARIGAGTIFYLANAIDPTWEPNSFIAQLSKLDKLVYEQQRRPAAKALGMRPKVLDEEVEARRALNAAEHLLFEHWDVKPWPDPVNAADLLAAVIDEVERYVATLGNRAIVVALWIMFTWVHDACTHSPLLLVWSPEADSGKTTLLSVISYLAWRPIKSVNITGPMLYRSIEKWHPTLVIDEADTAFKDNDDLRQVMNSGWTRGDGVIRGNPETHDPHVFSTFAPKTIGMKGRNLIDTTLSRTIEIVMKPKLADEEVSDFQHADEPMLADLRSMLARWAADNIEDLRKAKPEVPPGFNNRLRMNWWPLFAIANLAGMGEKAWEAALAIEQRKDVDPSMRIKVLADILGIYNEELGAAAKLKEGEPDAEPEEVDGILARELVQRLNDDDEKGWSTAFKDGQPLTMNRLAWLLRGFGIRSEDIHKEEEPDRDLRGNELGRKHVHAKGYKWVRFFEAWTRYLNFQPPPKTDP